MVGRIGDDQIPIAPEPVGEEIVNDPAGLVAETRVLSPTHLDPAHVIGKHQLQELQRPGPLHLDLPHVRDVEHPHMRPHRRMLLPNPLIGNRHLPPRKRNELRPPLSVEIVQGSAPQDGLGHAPNLLKASQRESGPPKGKEHPKQRWSPKGKEHY